METIHISKDIKVFYKTASSFPAGVLEAHQTLHKLVPFTTDRKYFGISRPENGAIVYRAATEEMQPGEAEKLHCETMALKKGNYISVTIPHFMKDISAIEKTFKMLTDQPGLDSQGYCVELYLNDAQESVQCMIRLKD